MLSTAHSAQYAQHDVQTDMQHLHAASLHTKTWLEPAFVQAYIASIPRLPAYLEWPEKGGEQHVLHIGWLHK